MLKSYSQQKIKEDTLFCILYNISLKIDNIFRVYKQNKMILIFIIIKLSFYHKSFNYKTYIRYFIKITL